MAAGTLHAVELLVWRVFGGWCGIGKEIGDRLLVPRFIVVEWNSALSNINNMRVFTQGYIFTFQENCTWHMILILQKLPCVNFPWPVGLLSLGEHSQ